MTLKWARDAWTNDNAPMLAIERDVNARLKNGLTWATLATWEPAENDTDARHWYRYAYALYRWRHQHGDSYEIRQDGWDVLTGMGTPQGPQPRLYIRLRFLWDASLDPGADNEWCLPLAQRLLAAVPTDYDVRWHYVNLRAYEWPRVSFSETLAAAEKLRRSDPTRAGAYELLGYFHHVRAGLPGVRNVPAARTADLEASASAYRRWLQLAKCSDDGKAFVRSEMKQVLAALKQ